VSQAVDAAALDTIFRQARSRNGWALEPLPGAVIREIYDLAKLGPTSVNMSPARFVWVATPQNKQKLAALASGTNGAKILKAPVTVIIGYDLDFPETLPRLFPHNQHAKNWFNDPVLRESGAFRNSSLQGAYLLIAARALGYDTGPMSGFDNAAVDSAFFSGTNIKSNFICSIGRGTNENLFPRSPRLSFEEANRIV
jgi:3-hydroxypropanoate dehydrogenase